MPGLDCCAGFSLAAMRRDYCPAVGRRLLTAVASPVVEHRLESMWAQRTWLPGSQAQAQ